MEFLKRHCIPGCDLRCLIPVASCYRKTIMILFFLRRKKYWIYIFKLHGRWTLSVFHVTLNITLRQWEETAALRLLHIFKLQLSLVTMIYGFTLNESLSVYNTKGLCLGKMVWFYGMTILVADVLLFNCLLNLLPQILSSGSDRQSMPMQ